MVSHIAIHDIPVCTEIKNQKLCVLEIEEKTKRARPRRHDFSLCGHPKNTTMTDS